MNDIEQIAKIIVFNGGNLYLVGGAVRDEILGRKSLKDSIINKVLEIIDRQIKK